MFPVFARPNAIELRMGDAELFGDHFKPVFIVEQQFLDDSNLALGQFIITRLPGKLSILEVWVVAIVLNHFIPRHPFQVQVIVILLVMIEVNDKCLIGLATVNEVFGH